MAKNEFTLENIPEVKKLIEVGKVNHEITYDEINDILPDKLLNSEKIDDIFILLNQMGVDFGQILPLWSQLWLHCLMYGSLAWWLLARSRLQGDHGIDEMPAN